MDLKSAAGLEHAGEIGTGHGGYYNDLDMLQIGQGDFDVRTGGADAFARSRSHYTQHVMLRSTLLLSTVLSELPPSVLGLFLNREAIAIHQVAPVVNSLMHHPVYILSDSLYDTCRGCDNEFTARGYHQDPWGKQARRVASVRPAVAELTMPFNAWMVVAQGSPFPSDVV